LSATEQNAVNTLVIALKADGIWTKMKAIYPMVGASAAACRQNLKSASFTGTFTGCTFASTGITPNGTSGFMDTGFVPSANFTADNSSFGVYQRQNTINGGTALGSQTSGNNSTRIFMFIKYDAGGTSQFNHNNGPTNPTITNSSGFITSNRNNINEQKAYRNGSVILNTAILESVTLSGFSIYLGATNISATPDFYSNRELSFAYIGDGLTDTESTNFYTALQAFQTSLSRQV
jgi:hypothetical protein